MPILLSQPLPEVLGQPWFGDEGTVEEREYVAALRAAGDLVTCRGLAEAGRLATTDSEHSDSPSDDEQCASGLLASLERVAAEGAEVALEEMAKPVLLAMLRECDALDAVTAARRHEVLVALAGEVSSGVSVDEVHVEHEVQVARRSSRYAAGKAIEIARAITATFPGFADALAAGAISPAHCAVLVERTRLVRDEEALAHIARRALPKAKRLAPGELGREIAKLIAGYDPDAAGRMTRARQDRRVWTRPLDDGQSFLGLVHDTATVEAIKECITTDALAIRHAARATDEQAGSTPTDATATGATTGEPGTAAAPAPRTTEAIDADADWALASLDALRADALAARLLGRIGPDGSVEWDRSEARIILNVVMDLDTLRSAHDLLGPDPDDTVGSDQAGDVIDADDWDDEDRVDHHHEPDERPVLPGTLGEGDTEPPPTGAPPSGLALVDRDPVPASLARDLADAARWWRRIVVDPVDGHLLDYGPAVYLPQRLRRFVLARDRGCRAPGCTTRAERFLQMDHAVEHDPTSPDGGDSSTTNCGTLCTRCHQLKTARRTRITDSAPDGSATWTTAWGQRVVIPPRAYLDDPAPGSGSVADCDPAAPAPF